MVEIISYNKKNRLFTLSNGEKFLLFRVSENYPHILYIPSYKYREFKIKNRLEFKDLHLLSNLNAREFICVFWDSEDMRQLIISFYMNNREKLAQELISYHNYVIS